MTIQDGLADSYNKTRKMHLKTIREASELKEECATLLDREYFGSDSE